LQLDATRLKNLYMAKSRHPRRDFNASSDSGSVLAALPQYSSGFLREQGGSRSQVTDDEVVSAAFGILSRRLTRTTSLESPHSVREYLAIRFGRHEHEVFSCLFLDNQHRLIAIEELFRGTIDGASIHPREVVKRALAHNAAALILSHNHPSGVAEPSPADQLITLRLREALGLVDIRLLDHLIVGGARTVSFAERGLI
jgi:DNA repair protein RadC